MGDRGQQNPRPPKKRGFEQRRIFLFLKKSHNPSESENRLTMHPERAFVNFIQRILPPSRSASHL